MDAIYVAHQLHNYSDIVSHIIVFYINKCYIHNKHVINYVCVCVESGLCLSSFNYLGFKELVSDVSKSGIMRR